MNIIDRLLPQLIRLADSDTGISPESALQELGSMPGFLEEPAGIPGTGDSIAALSGALVAEGFGHLEDAALVGLLPSGLYITTTKGRGLVNFLDGRVDRKFLESRYPEYVANRTRREAEKVPDNGGVKAPPGGTGTPETGTGAADEPAGTGSPEQSPPESETGDPWDAPWPPRPGWPFRREAILSGLPLRSSSTAAVLAVMGEKGEASVKDVRKAVFGLLRDARRPTRTSRKNREIGPWLKDDIYDCIRDLASANILDNVFTGTYKITEPGKLLFRERREEITREFLRSIDIKPSPANPPNSGTELPPLSEPQPVPDPCDITWDPPAPEPEPEPRPGDMTEGPTAPEPHPRPGNITGDPPLPETKPEPGDMPGGPPLPKPQPGADPVDIFGGPPAPVPGRKRGPTPPAGAGSPADVIREYAGILRDDVVGRLGEKILKLPVKKLDDLARRLAEALRLASTDPASPPAGKWGGPVRGLFDSPLPGEDKLMIRVKAGAVATASDLESLVADMNGADVTRGVLFAPLGLDGGATDRLGNYAGILCALDAGQMARLMHDHGVGVELFRRVVCRVPDPAFFARLDG
ncbi:MAG: hypothetical protein LBT40_00100 [Deltaproteobacteria bacterium]|nr:hypothetical protein [Deltaproteobacteria bacterium]